MRQAPLCHPVDRWTKNTKRLHQLPLRLDNSLIHLWVGPAQGIDSTISQKRSPFQSFQPGLSAFNSFNRYPSTSLRCAQDRRSVQIVQNVRKSNLITKSVPVLPTGGYWADAGRRLDEVPLSNLISI